MIAPMKRNAAHTMTTWNGRAKLMVSLQVPLALLTILQWLGRRTSEKHPALRYEIRHFNGAG